MRRFALFCALLLLADCTSEEAKKKEEKGEGAKIPTGPTVADVVEGRKLYLTYGCVGCHGVAGGGGMGKPILDDEWIFGSDDATLTKLIRGEIPKQTMPGAIGKALTDEQIRKVIVYVRFIYQGDRAKINWAVPPPVSEDKLTGAVSAGDAIAAGKVLFMSACSPCHGQQGHGDGPSSKDLNPKPRNLTDAKYMAPLDDRYLFELISRGGIAVGKSPQMPQFPLASQDIGNLIAYVRTLSKTGSADPKAAAPPAGK
jgi:mono/diheme cytochrome c family protein